MSRRTTTRGLIAAFAATCFVLIGGSAAFAQGYNGGGAGTVTFTIDDSSVSAGQAVGVSGTGCDPGSNVVFTIGDTQVGSTTADASGNYSGSVTIPSNLSPGQYTITATCGSQVLSLDITVGSGGGGTPISSGNGGLSRTGFDLAPLASVGAAAVVLGAAAVYGTRRKRHPA